MERLIVQLLLSLGLFWAMRSCIICDMKQKIAITIGCVATLTVLLIINMTTPSGIGPFGVLLFLFSLYVALTSALYILLRFLFSILHVPKPRDGSKNRQDIKLYYFSSVLALAPVILLGIQSIGGIKLFDLCLVVIFEVIACLYVYKRF